MPAQPLTPGQVFDERYEIVASIGSGGMATVYEAKRLGVVDSCCALKLLELSSEANETSRALSRKRFHHGAAILFELKHPHIVEVTEFATAQDGTPYLIMEKLTGEDLAAMLDRVPERQLPWRTAFAIAEQVGEALEYLHTQNVLHRDVTPANIFLCATGPSLPEECANVKLLDFGIATRLNSLSAPKTIDGFRIGNQPYMAPERILNFKGVVLDGRSDQFSLACVLFEMLAGRRAFVPKEGEETWEAVCTADPFSGELPPHFTPILRRVLGRALNKHPHERYPSIKELMEELRALDLGRELQNPESAVSEPDAAEISAVPHGPSETANTTGSMSPMEQLRFFFASPAMRQTKFYFMGLLAVVLCLGVLIYRPDFIWRTSQWGNSTTEQPPQIVAVLNPDPSPQKSVSLPSTPQSKPTQVSSGTHSDSTGNAGTSTPSPVPSTTSVPQGQAEKSPQSNPKGAESSANSTNGPGPERRVIRPARFRYVYANDAQRQRSEPLLGFFKSKIMECLKQHPGWSNIQVTYWREFHVSGLSTPEKNQDLSACINRNFPPQKTLPLKTEITRGSRE